MTNGKKIRLWFVWAGGFGVAIALALATIARMHSISPTILMMLWPWSIVGIADPSTPSEKLFFGLVEFGGQFLTFGMIGALTGAVFLKSKKTPV
jgi:hypothetical protein